MYQLVMLAKISSKQYAYCFSTENRQEYIDFSQRMAEEIPSELFSYFSTHFFNGKTKTFKDIQKMDPYFRDVRQVMDYHDFLKELQGDIEFDAIDVASYLQRRYAFPSFVLQKTLYFVYAELLTEYGRPIFKAEFEAYDRGPVERSVYRDNKYTDKLADNYDFMPKVAALDDAQHIIDVINETAQKYGQYYQQHDAWNHEADNLTHRPGTPWSIAHAKGQNTLLSDDDILKYHALERL